MASVEGNWVILYRWVIAGELWQCWFWTTQVQFLILLLLPPLSQWTTKCWPGNHRWPRGKVRQWVEVLMTGCYHICSNPHLLTQENYIALLLTSLPHYYITTLLHYYIPFQNCNLSPIFRPRMSLLCIAHGNLTCCIAILPVGTRRPNVAIEACHNVSDHEVRSPQPSEISRCWRQNCRDQPKPHLMSLGVASASSRNVQRNISMWLCT